MAWKISTCLVLIGPVFCLSNELARGKVLTSEGLGWIWCEVGYHDCVIVL